MLSKLGCTIFNIKEKRKFQLCESSFNYWHHRFYGHEYISIEDRVWIGDGSWIVAKQISDVKPSMVLSRDASIGRFAHIYITGKLIIGKGALIAEKVYISDNLHEFDDINMPIKEQPLRQLKEVTIGEGSWIGENVCIIGASVGKNSVVGANSVVTHDIPDYCVAVGAPAKVIKRYDFDLKQWIKVELDK